MTRYAYDDTTFWLKRLKTEQYSKDTSIPNQVIYQAQSGTTLQEGFAKPSFVLIQRYTKF